MDVETAKTIQDLIRMIDNVNERNSLGQLVLNGVMVLLASNRRNGMLNETEIEAIDQSFKDIETDESLKRYEKVRDLFEAARKMWDAAELK